MSKRTGFITTILAIAAFFVFSSADAASINLLPTNTSVFVGDIFNIDIVADIDASEAIFAFGFDLVLSEIGVVDFNGFSPNASIFGIDPDHEFFSDLDGILGATDGNWLTGPAVYGEVLLGTLSFTATGVGNVQVGLDADDLGDFSFYTEGLIPEDIALINFMPDVFSAEVNVAAVPEPATMLLVGAGLCGIAGFRRKFKK